MKLSLIAICLLPALVFSQTQGKNNHSGSNLNCKTCHSCEYPTVQNPCLIDCPREDLITIRHSASVGPESIVLDRFSDRYGPVAFSHRLHAEMADMGGGCQSCHHYNTTGPVLACGSCHEAGSKTAETGVPGLVAAYHRQCMSCHREWQHTVECQSCHALAKDVQTAAKGTRTLKDKKHTKVAQPTKVVYETKTDQGSKATFFHDQHTKVFGVSCTNCHQGQGCVDCHDVKKETPSLPILKTSDPRTEEEKHRACFSCHQNDACSTCHAGTELKPFDHFRRTGWAIKPYHGSLGCRQCHKSGDRFTAVNRDCSSCHDLEKRGSFRHEVTGVRFDDNHLGLSCSDCHAGKRYDRTPDCSSCHDDKQWPKHIPGKRWP